MPDVEKLYPYLLPPILGGFGYLFVYYFWEPIRQMDNKKREIITAITKYANIRKHSTFKKNHDYDGPGELHEEVLLNQNELEQTTYNLRQYAGELRAIINRRKTYALLSLIHLVPPKSKVELAAKCLIGWSNSFGQENESKLIGDFINNLAQALDIPIS